VLKQYKLIIFLFLSAFVSSAFAAATITITNGNAPNVGFNDNSPFTPVGGNNATTLGQARLNAVQYTANKLSTRLNSSIKIEIVTVFESRGGNSMEAVLAGAYAPVYQQNFIGAPLVNTLYHVAIAEKIAGRDFNGNLTGGNQFDVIILVNQDIDGNIALGASKWYYGFDQNPTVQNGRRDIDFVTVLTHEILHGLGFSTQMDSITGARFQGLNDNFIQNLEDHSAAPIRYTTMTTNIQRAAANRSGRLHWVGAAITASANNNVGFQNGHAAMYAPNQVREGSSVSHFSTIFAGPDQMMEPSYRGPTHDIGLAAQVLDDVGWGKLNSNPVSTDLSIKVTNPNPNPAVGGNETYSITVTNEGIQTATGIIVSNFLPANSTFVSVNPAAGGSCDSSNVLQNRIVSCSLASLPASGTAIFNVVATINNAGQNIFSANVEALNPDPLFANNNAVNQTGALLEMPPILSTLVNQVVEEGQTVSFIVSASDPNGPIPIMTINGKPGNAIFTDNANGTATFTWVTQTADIGIHNVSFKASDGNIDTPGSDTKSMTITVNAKPVVDPQPGSGASPTEDSTGGCTLNKTAKFDPLFPVLLLILSVMFLSRKLQKVRTKS